MKYLVILTALFSASAALAGGSGGTMGSPNKIENLNPARTMAGGLQPFNVGSVLNDLNKLELLLQTQVLSENEEALVRGELSKTNLRFKSLLQKLEASGIDTQNLETTVP